MKIIHKYYGLSALFAPRASHWRNMSTDEMFMFKYRRWFRCWAHCRRRCHKSDARDSNTAGGRNTYLPTPICRYNYVVPNLKHTYFFQKKREIVQIGIQINNCLWQFRMQLQPRGCRCEKFTGSLLEVKIRQNNPPLTH